MQPQGCYAAPWSANDAVQVRGSGGAVQVAADPQRRSMQDIRQDGEDMLLHSLRLTILMI